MGRQRCSLDVYRAPLFTRESLDPLTHRAEPLWSRDDTIMSYPSRAKGAEHASHRANHLRPAFRDDRFPVGRIRPTIGLMRSFTSEFTTADEATPMTKPMARPMTPKV